MSYSDLLHWLNGAGNYAAGVALYKKTSNGHPWLSLFESAETSVTHKLLREELQKLYDRAAEKDNSPKIKAPAKAELPKPESFTEVRENKYPKINPSLLPEVLKPTWKKIVALLKEQGTLHSRLPIYQSDEERLTAALRILDIDDEFSPLWKDFMRWHDTGEVPVTAQEKKSDEENPFGLMDDLNRLNVAITRARKEKAAKSHITKLEKERESLKQKIAECRKAYSN